MELVTLKANEMEAIEFEGGGRILIELQASNDLMCGVLDNSNYEDFQDTNVDFDDISWVKFYGATTSQEFTFRSRRGELYFLVLLNPSSRKSVNAAYRMEALDG